MKACEDLGERRIIEIIQNQLDKMPEMAIPFGDDVSAIDIGNNNLAILKADMLVGKTDVPPKMSLWQAARKAVVMNISDLAAKGVKPLVLLVSLGLPRTLARRDIVQLGKGLNAGAREYGAYVIGGDTGESTDLTISISLFGIARKGEVILRSGARSGDVLAVTGLFGKTAAGLKILLSNHKASKGIRETLVESVLMPHARLKEGLALCASKAVTASIDSSDGLAWSLHELAKASNVGFLVDKLPVAIEVVKFAEINRLDPLEFALYGGEEYELVITVKPKLWRKAEKAVEEVGGTLLPIGKATAEKRVLLKVNGEKRVIEARGWEHLKPITRLL
jgi:thiamine-monophosphate kinase